jgi:hypothetical protein
LVPAKPDQDLNKEIFIRLFRENLRPINNFSFENIPFSAAEGQPA